MPHSSSNHPHSMMLPVALNFHSALGSPKARVVDESDQIDKKDGVTLRSISRVSINILLFIGAGLLVLGTRRVLYQWFGEYYIVIAAIIALKLGGKVCGHGFYSQATEALELKNTTPTEAIATPTKLMNIPALCELKHAGKNTKDEYQERASLQVEAIDHKLHNIQFHSTTPEKDSVDEQEVGGLEQQSINNVRVQRLETTSIAAIDEISKEHIIGIGHLDSKEQNEDISNMISEVKTLVTSGSEQDIDKTEEIIQNDVIMGCISAHHFEMANESIKTGKSAPEQGGDLKSSDEGIVELEQEQESKVEANLEGAATNQEEEAFVRQSLEEIEEQRLKEHTEKNEESGNILQPKQRIENTRISTEISRTAAFKDYIHDTKSFYTAKQATLKSKKDSLTFQTWKEGDRAIIDHILQILDTLAYKRHVIAQKWAICESEVVARRLSKWKETYEKVDVDEDGDHSGCHNFALYHLIWLIWALRGVSTAELSPEGFEDYYRSEERHRQASATAKYLSGEEEYVMNGDCSDYYHDPDRQCSYVTFEAFDDEETELVDVYCKGPDGTWCDYSFRTRRVLPIDDNAKIEPGEMGIDARNALEAYRKEPVANLTPCEGTDAMFGKVVRFQADYYGHDGLIISEIWPTVPGNYRFSPLFHVDSSIPAVNNYEVQNEQGGLCAEPSFILGTHKSQDLENGKQHIDLDSGYYSRSPVISRF